jgi:hypothetical protein
MRTSLGQGFFCLSERFGRTSDGRQANPILLVLGLSGHCEIHKLSNTISSTACTPASDETVSLRRKHLFLPFFIYIWVVALGRAGCDRVGLANLTILQKHGMLPVSRKAPSIEQTNPYEQHERLDSNRCEGR